MNDVRELRGAGAAPAPVAPTDPSGRARGLMASPGLCLDRSTNVRGGTFRGGQSAGQRLGTGTGARMPRDALQRRLDAMFEEMLREQVSAVEGSGSDAARYYLRIGASECRRCVCGPMRLRVATAGWVSCLVGEPNPCLSPAGCGGL